MPTCVSGVTAIIPRRRVPRRHARCGIEALTRLHADRLGRETVPRECSPQLGGTAGQGIRGPVVGDVNAGVHSAPAEVEVDAIIAAVNAFDPQGEV